MGKSIPYILGIMVVIGIGSILQYRFCCSDGVAEVDTLVEFPKNNQGLPLSIQAPNDDFSITLPTNFNFPLSSYSFILPLDSALVHELGRLSEYMKKNQENMVLTITGFHYQQEKNLSAFPTLGEARANAVKSNLIDRGISGTQLRVTGSSAGEWMSEDTIVYGPIHMGLESLQKAEIEDTAIAKQEEKEELEKIISEINTEPMVLHFETGRAYVDLSIEERERISKLNTYLDQSDQSRILIVGHADNSGNSETNLKLGKERAEFLKSYLVRNGFQPSRIETRTKGDEEPIASNLTEEGRAENRRAVMTLLDK